jgi:putative membrane protein
VSLTRRLALSLAANALALAVAHRLFHGVHIHGVSAYVIGAAALGFANAILRPLLTLLTLPLVIFTLGLFLLVINIAMVAFAAWVTPHFTLHGFWTYVGTIIVVWLCNWAVHAALRPRRRRRR